MTKPENDTSESPKSVEETPEVAAEEEGRESEPAGAGSDQAVEPEEPTEPEQDVADETPPPDALAAEVADLKGQLLRALAETENVRRRAANERQDVVKYAITGFARDLVGVVDNLRRALESVADDVREDERLAPLVAGVEMTERELSSVLERHHIRPIDPLGERFDHDYHQALREVKDSGKPAGTIVEVMQVGYLIADRLLRPALVGVAKDSGGEPPPRVDTEA